MKETYVTARTLDVELESWMTEVAPFQWRTMKPFQPKAAALLVVDMTRPFVEAGYPLASPNAPAIIPHLAKVIAAFRAAGRPVIWMVQGHHSLKHDRGEKLAAWWPTTLQEGTSDVKLAAGLSMAKGEKLILKRRYSGFYQTDLELTLRCLGIRQVVVAGVLTHVCPYTTAFDAFMRDLDVFYLADGTAALNRRQHVTALQNIAGWCGAVVRGREVCDWLRAKGGSPEAKRRKK